MRTCLKWLTPCFLIVQDPNKPGYLRNDNNEYLNYTDDW